MWAPDIRVGISLRQRRCRAAKGSKARESCRRSKPPYELHSGIWATTATTRHVGFFFASATQKRDWESINGYPVPS